MKEYLLLIKRWWREQFMIRRAMLPEVAPRPTSEPKANNMIVNIDKLMLTDWTEYSPHELASIELVGVKILTINQAIDRLSSGIMSLRWTDRENKALFNRPEDIDLLSFLTSGNVFNRGRNDVKIKSFLNLARSLVIAYEREKDVKRYPAQKHNRLVCHDDIEEVRNIMQSLTAASNTHK